MPKCGVCGSEDVAWRQSAKGGWYLVDTKRPHFCKKPPKEAAPGGAHAPLNPEADEAVEYLVGPTFQMKLKEARRLVLGLQGTTESIVREALKRKGSD